MAVNRKGGNAIVALLLAHGEKLGIALALLLAGWLVYGSLSYESIEQEPSSLGKTAEEALQRVNGFTWNDAQQQEEGASLAIDFRPIKSVEVEPPNYAVSGSGLNPSVLPRTVLRPDPPLLAATSLTVRGGTDLMGFEDESFRRNRELDAIREEKREEKEREAQRAREQAEGFAGDGRDGQPEVIRVTGSRGGVSLDEDDKREILSYAIVLAKVPVEEQIDLFRSVLKNAAGYNRASDQPEYLGYYVQRREVSRGKAGEWRDVLLRNTFDDEKLDVVDIGTIEITSLDWVEELSDLAADDYLVEGITFPLPPLVGRDWGVEVVHPDVPLQAEVDLLDKETDRRESRRDRGRGRDSGGVIRRRAQKDQEALAAETAALEEAQERIYPQPFIMLRFFDLNVRAGRQYQYRLQLVVRDPNASISRSKLAKDVIARWKNEGDELLPDERLRRTPWSEASPVVSIPQAGGVLLSSVEQPRRGASNAEPSVQMVVDAFDTLGGEKAPSATQRKLQRGSVANFRGLDVPYITGSRELQTAEEFNYRTDITILDIFGGQPLGRDNTLPASVLVMDASGRMSIHSELTDSTKAEETLKRYSGEEDSRGGGRSTYDPNANGF